MRVLLLGLACWAAAPAAERVTCPVVADAHVYATPWNSNRPDDSEAFDNFGATPYLTVKGREYFALLAFDCSAARGLTVEKATLRIRRNANAVPLSTVGVSTISGNGPWAEGTQRGGRAQPGAVNYHFARTGQQSWAYAGSDLSDVTFGLGGSLYAYRGPRDAGDGWFEIDLPPVIAAALATGDQFGLELTDEKGQVGGRHNFSSRETQSPPVLILEGNRSDQTAPGAVLSRQEGDIIDSTPEEARRLGRTILRQGSVVLLFGGAGDDAGEGIATRYEVRYGEDAVTAASFASATPVPRWMMDPLAPKPHPLATANTLRDEVSAVVEELKPGALYYFAARAIDEAGNAGPVSPLGRYRAYARAYPALPSSTSHKLQATSGARRSSAAASPDIWAVPELVKIHPQTGALLEQEEAPDHRLRNAVWDASSGTVRLSGARNEFVAFQLAIESDEPLNGIEVAVTQPLFTDCALPEIFRTTGTVQLFREWFIRDDKPDESGGPWYPDALVPWSGPVDLPSRDNPVPGQRVQPVFVDVYIPRDAAPGVHTGRVAVRAGEQLNREITIEVEVLPLTLPDRLNFVVDLNAYGGVNAGYNISRGTPAYRALVRAYHRLAHLNRANLNVLGYSHSGSVEPDYSPPLTGQGSDTRVAGWEDWDAHFGPLVDGSAFADLPRAGVPVTNLYLNFHENWPGDLRADYKWNNYPIPATTEEYRALIARHGLEAGPIEEGFSGGYQDRFSAVARQFAEHFRERGWTQTRYQVYFNNKYFYKDPAQGARGVSWWLLDEPNHRDDIRALSFFGDLAKRWLDEYPDVPIVWRTDISYIDFMRDLLAGQIDLNCTSQRFFSKNRYLMDHRDRFGRDLWHYASTNHPRESNAGMRAWCWRVWTAGGEGLVPWNTVRGSESWERAEPLTVFYPGSKFGKNEPYASLRLKAFRRGQQDVEYLILLAAREGWDREAVSYAVTEAMDFEKVKDADLETLRQRVARALVEP
ncbi:MAG: DUF4091 domain-containing protein [Acidobacteria bacterium]|nr:DUF4091 domain-containing protein [Acidobacteriota bacterium]